MLRPILPLAAWQAITALAGFFTLACALAAPVELWRLSVKSHQGEPFRAFAPLASLPEDHITEGCLSMGPESDAPGSGMPFLSTANLKLNAARDAVEISTEEPITTPRLAMVVRVQCAGAPLYARHFNVLIAPAAATASQRRAGGTPAKRRGLHLSLLRGDSIEGIAAVLFPGRSDLQQDLVQQVIAGNPDAFPNGINREVATGTMLWLPDPREIRKSARAISPASAKAGASATRLSGRRIAEPSAEALPPQVAEAMPAEPRDPVTLRRSLTLGTNPGPHECRQLMQLCDVETPAPAPVAPALDVRVRTLETRMQELRLKQDSIDQQLAPLEQSLQSLERTVSSAAMTRAQTEPQPPLPSSGEIRTVVKTEALSWTILLGFGGLIVIAVIGGFAFGRRGSFTRGLAETDAQLDRMLATAANVMREIESEPRPAPEKSGVERAPAEELKRAPASVRDNQASINVDLKPASGPSPQLRLSDLSNELLFEIDQALDSTHSVFTDVDRFIALGRTQNALSVLQFQVHRDPKDRDSWIKLMAIYRQENMDAELTKAVREFRTNFPDENPPAV